MAFNVGARLKQLKHEKGYSYTDIATKAGLTASYISNVHQGKTVGIKNLEKICSAIGITLADFFQADIQPVDMAVLDAVADLSEDKKRQLVAFLNGLSDSTK
jgi:transcriptional regulator with XRE-family HTH domain